METNKIYLGDNLELLKQLDSNSIHSTVSDFPYNLGFMGKEWDTITNYYDWCKLRADELFRVLKSGGYCLIFGGTRTHHRLVCAFEDAGFEIRDEMQWIYGSGFPKSYNISKGFDKKAGAEREIIGETKAGKTALGQGSGWNKHNNITTIPITAPSTDLAKQWDGWGTALKPAQEPIMVCQKPIEKNYCYNVEKYGVGGLNIDDSRIKFGNNESAKDLARSSQGFTSKSEIYNNSDNYKTSCEVGNENGRFPANIIFDEESAKILDEQTGILKSGSVKTEGFKGEYSGNIYGKYANNQINPNSAYGDSGGASRFFYCAKATKKDRTENGLVNNTHVTVKPTELIKYLVRLVTPKNGICLDICEGSGTHAKACIQLSKEDYPVNYIGFENDVESYNISLERIVANN